MPQGNFIAGAIVIAFLMFVTLRGELPAYLQLFKPKPQAAPSGNGGGGGSKSDSTKQTISTVIHVAELAAEFA